MNASAVIANSIGAAPAAATVPAPFGPRLFIGVMGVLLAAIMSGVNNRVGGLALADVRASLGAGADDGSWLTVMYSACELAAMPISAWFSVTFSFRRYHLAVVAIFAGLGMLMPAVHSLPVLIALRGLQGFFGGLLIPVLMSAALRFFPLPLRLYGLSLYALTATFSPNVSTWIAALWTDRLTDVTLIYWQIVPLAAMSMAAVGWGLPQDPVRLERFRQINWLGLATGCSGLVLIAIALGQGERLDWLNSPLIRACFVSGIPLIVIYLMSEWFHPLPFVSLQLLRRRNLGLGFTIFTGLLVVLLSGSLLPADYLEHEWGFRSEHVASIGAIVGVPQLILGPLVSWLLYKQWVDARKLFSLGLVLIAASCLAGSHLTSAWMEPNFVLAQSLQAMGQPMAVISMLFLATSVVQPMEGPFVSGIVNTLRAFGTLFGDALVGHFIVQREKFHSNVLIDHAGSAMSATRHRLTQASAPTAELASFAEQVRHQAFVLATSDGYLAIGAFALVLIPLVLRLQYISPPTLKKSGH
jgi:DHA2 family multidrug resistance protein